MSSQTKVSSCRLYAAWFGFSTVSVPSPSPIHLLGPVPLSDLVSFLSVLHNGQDLACLWQPAKIDFSSIPEKDEKWVRYSSLRAGPGMLQRSASSVNWIGLSIVWDATWLVDAAAVLPELSGGKERKRSCGVAAWPEGLDWIFPAERAPLSTGTPLQARRACAENDVLAKNFEAAESLDARRQVFVGWKASSISLGLPVNSSWRISSLPCAHSAVLSASAPKKKKKRDQKAKEAWKELERVGSDMANLFLAECQARDEVSAPLLTTVGLGSANSFVIQRSSADKSACQLMDPGRGPCAFFSSSNPSLLVGPCLSSFSQIFHLILAKEIRRHATLPDFGRSRVRSRLVVTRLPEVFVHPRTRCGLTARLPLTGCELPSHFPSFSIRRFS